MAVKFEFYETPTPDDKKGEKKYHARVVSYSTVDTEQIIRNIHTSCTLTRGDIKACLAELSRVLAEKLLGGERVHLEGLGYFQVTLQCDSGATNPKTRSHHVSYKTVKFRPDKELNQEMTHLKVERSSIRKHSERMDNETIEARLLEYLETHDSITRKELESLCGLTRTTAGRHITRLVREHKIKNTNYHFQPIYVKA